VSEHWIWSKTTVFRVSGTVRIVRAKEGLFQPYLLRTGGFGPQKGGFGPLHSDIRSVDQRSVVGTVSQNSGFGHISLDPGSQNWLNSKGKRGRFQPVSLRTVKNGCFWTCVQVTNSVTLDQH